MAQHRKLTGVLTGVTPDCRPHDLGTSLLFEQSEIAVNPITEGEAEGGFVAGLLTLYC
jgi:hypothetical protein